MKLTLVIENLILSFCFDKCYYCKVYFDKEGLSFYYDKYPICYKCLGEMWSHKRLR